MTAGPPRKSRIFYLPVALVLLVGLGAWLLLRRGTPAPPPEATSVEDETVPPPTRPSRPPTKHTAPLVTTGARPLEYSDDGIPFVPAKNDDPRPDGPMHFHPITPEHKRIFRENLLLGQLNGAMDVQDAAGIRKNLKIYEEEFPDDPQQMQSGYAIVADCLDRPSPAVRAAAQHYFDTERASTLRRFILRYCLQN